MYGNALYGYDCGEGSRAQLLSGAYVGQAYGGSRGPAGSTGAMAGMPLSGSGSPAAAMGYGIGGGAIGEVVTGPNPPGGAGLSTWPPARLTGDASAIWMLLSIRFRPDTLLRARRMASC